MRSSLCPSRDVRAAVPIGARLRRWPCLRRQADWRSIRFRALRAEAPRRRDSIFSYGGGSSFWLHDISYGAVAAVFLIVPGLQIIVLVILGLMPGKKGLNRFGPDPLAVMTVRDAAPVRRTERSDTVRCPAREVRETLEGEVVEPGPDLEGTIIRERMSAEAEDWASDLIAGAKARIEASPESREGEVAAVRAGLVAARNEGRLTQSAFVRWVQILEGL